MTTELVLQRFGLSKGISYSQKINAFVSDGYTSYAGNTYFNAVRFAEGIVIKEDVGIGYARKFLNGLKIYSLKDKALLADRTYHSFFYSEYGIKSEAVDMLMNVLKKAAKKEGFTLDKKKARKQIETIIDEALKKYQPAVLEQQSKKYLPQ
jgi:hypothetical protein